MRLDHEFRSKVSDHGLFYNEITDPSMDKKVHLEEITRPSIEKQIGAPVRLCRKFLVVANEPWEDKEVL
jgi:hypothetical protein